MKRSVKRTWLRGATKSITEVSGGNGDGDGDSDGDGGTDGGSGGAAGGVVVVRSSLFMARVQAVLRRCFVEEAYAPALHQQLYLMLLLHRLSDNAGSNFSGNGKGKGYIGDGGGCLQAPLLCDRSLWDDFTLQLNGRLRSNPIVQGQCIEGLACVVRAACVGGGGGGDGGDSLASLGSLDALWDTWLGFVRGAVDPEEPVHLRYAAARALYISGILHHTHTPSSSSSSVSLSLSRRFLGWRLAIDLLQDDDTDIREMARAILCAALSVVQNEENQEDEEDGSSAGGRADGSVGGSGSGVGSGARRGGVPRVHGSSIEADVLRAAGDFMEKRFWMLPAYTLWLLEGVELPLVEKKSVMKFYK